MPEIGWKKENVDKNWNNSEGGVSKYWEIVQKYPEYADLYHKPDFLFIKSVKVWGACHREQNVKVPVTHWDWPVEGVK